MDFTLEKYDELLHALDDNGYQFLTLEQYCNQKEALSDARFVILRHDVDLKAENSLATAKIEHALEKQASYYFRVVEQSNKPEVIKTEHIDNMLRLTTTDYGIVDCQLTGDYQVENANTVLTTLKVLKRLKFRQKVPYTFWQFIPLEILDILVLWEAGRTQPLGLAVLQSLTVLGIEKGAEKTLIAPFLSLGDLEQLVIFVSHCPEMELPGKVHESHRLLTFLLHSL